MDCHSPSVVDEDIASRSVASLDARKGLAVVCRCHLFKSNDAITAHMMRLKILFSHKSDVVYA